MNTTETVTPSNQEDVRTTTCVFARAKDILTWKNTVATTSTLVGINLGFLLFWASGISIIGLLCFFALGVMTIGFICSVMLGDTSEERRVEIMTKSQMEKASVRLYERINTLAADLRTLVLWKDHAVSAKACAFLGILGYVASWFTFDVLIYLGLNTLFFYGHLCKAYAKYAAPYVQQGLHLAKAQVNKLRQNVPHAKTT